VTSNKNAATSNLFFMSRTWYINLTKAGFFHAEVLALSAQK
jgi:hypothetical protein